jgi:hypothetical protein
VLEDTPENVSSTKPRTDRGKSQLSSPSHERKCR